ncbi:MAG: hypothetical protein NVS1B14_05700 [Vulcanimicrobiaceae bacterium]
MRRALELAGAAQAGGDVPIGAVRVTAQGPQQSQNTNQRVNDRSADAALLVLRESARRVGRGRLSDATMYVTKEPCVMCAGAMVAARIRRLVYGCSDPKGGAAGSVLNVLNNPALNHRVDVIGGVLAGEAAAQLQAFFRSKRI